jgi:hypothetical protein
LTRPGRGEGGFMNYEIKDVSKNAISRFSITSPDMEDEIVVLHIRTDTDIFIVHDCDDDVHQVIIPADCIETLISALNQLKEKL